MAGCKAVSPPPYGNIIFLFMPTFKGTHIVLYQGLGVLFICVFVNPVQLHLDTVELNYSDLK